MYEYNVDLHIHSLHSIGVSNKMTVPELAKGASLKGLDIMGTGDVTQPDWLSHLEKNLTESEDVLRFDSTVFIPTVEFEDKESIHHLIVLPDLYAAKRLRNMVSGDSPNINDEWGGRPRVNLNGEEIAGIVRDVGGLIGPAHAFTPFKAVFRESRHDSLKSCYGEETEHIHFIELGLSADSFVADHIPELRELTFVTSSDAHSPHPDKIGREFVRFRMESPTFDELVLGLRREKSRRPVLNVGMNPKMGKYYLSFCSKCRRTLVIREGDDPPEFDEMNVYLSCNNTAERKRLVTDIHARKITCPHDGKNLRLGVRDRAYMLGDGKSKHPDHRPHYLDIPPLLDMISPALGIKSKRSKTVNKLYNKLVADFGREIKVLTEVGIDDIRKHNESVAEMIGSYRDGTVEYIPGGGGRYGELIAPWETKKK